jgi:protein-disulfide isomerase
MEAQRLATARKERRNKILFTAAGVIVLALVVAVAIWGVTSSKTKGDGTNPPNAVGGHGIALGTYVEGAPTLEIFADYMCNHCQQVHLAFDPVLEEFANGDKVNVVLVTVNYLTGHSRMAAIAGACADIQGVYAEANHEFYAAADAKELDGGAIRNTIPEKIGLSGTALEEYQACVDTGQTDRFVQAATDYAHELEIGGTPSFYLNGDVLEQSRIRNSQTGDWDPDLLRAILDAQ